jgi:hypothetical protein
MIFLTQLLKLGDRQGKMPGVRQKKSGGVGGDRAAGTFGFWLVMAFRTDHAR